MVILLININAVLMVTIGRRRFITVWGEHISYGPFFGLRKDLFARDTTKIARSSNNAVNEVYVVRDRHGQKAFWRSWAFPYRTIVEFSHGQHINSLHMENVDPPGIFPYYGDGVPMQLPNGTEQPWAGGTVKLDVLISAHPVAITELTNLLTRAFSELRWNPEARPISNFHAVIGSSEITWTKNPGVNALEVQISAQGPAGLSEAVRAFTWIYEIAAKSVINTEFKGQNEPSFEDLEDKLHITYHEAWS